MGTVGKDHRYFNDDDANNEIDAVRAACRVMTEANLWTFAQRAILAAVEAQAIMRERFPDAWKRFDADVMRDEKIDR